MDIIIGHSGSPGYHTSTVNPETEQDSGRVRREKRGKTTRSFAEPSGVWFSDGIGSRV